MGQPEHALQEDGLADALMAHILPDAGGAEIIPRRGLIAAKAHHFPVFHGDVAAHRLIGKGGIALTSPAFSEIFPDKGTHPVLVGG